MHRLKSWKRTEQEDADGLGIHLRDLNLVSGDQEMLSYGYTGGKLTALLCYLLEKEEIDGAIVSVWGEASPFPWFSWPIIAKTRQDLVRGAGSKCVFSPNLLALEDAAARDDLRAIALAGLGCHVQGVRKLQLLGEPYRRLVEKVKNTFGLYCGAPMKSQGDFMEYTAAICGVSAAQITHVNFRRLSKEFDVSFEAMLKDGGRAEEQLNIMELFGVMQQHPRWYRCTPCTGYSADPADISFGGAHVTARTPAADQALEAALRDGWLVDAPADPLMEQISKQVDQAVSTMKKEDNRKRIARFKSEGKPLPNYE